MSSKNSTKKIIILPNHIINQIAAGEVVERPASVLKELLENAIDANSTGIKVFLEDGGIKSIKVVDNGAGMNPEDAKTAFLPHSTSKIKKIEDLDNIFTLGFRGEALASISSVSKVELVTKQKDSISGYRVEMHAGEIVNEEEIGTADGTMINIREIFYNTPARRKFLKTQNTELKHLIKAFTDTTLAHPEVKFELHHNGKKLYDLPITKDLRERIRNLIGDDFVKNSFQIEYDGIIKISGLVGLPKIATRRKATQIMIVNERPITNPTIIAAIKDAFHSAMPKGLYPQFVLNMTLDPSKVDVNVHPRKLEIRFSEGQSVYNAVKQAVRAGLEKSLQQDTKEKLSTFSSPTNEPNYIRKPSPTQNSRLYTLDSSKPSRSTIDDSLSFTKTLLNNIPMTPVRHLPAGEEGRGGRGAGGVFEDNNIDSEQIPPNLPLSGEEEYFPVFQLMNAYLITSNGNAIQIIDQHAAAERVTYERLMREFEDKNIETQSLLVPFELDLNEQELLDLKESVEHFESFGIFVEEFGNDSYVVREVPVELARSDLNSFIKELLNEIEEKDLDKKNQYEKHKERMITTMACHSSVRVGDKMSTQEINQLVKDLKGCDIPYSCPHGRPIIYEVPISELERKFKRK